MFFHNLCSCQKDNCERKGEAMRYVGIRHRVKKSVEGEAMPTMIAITEGGITKTYELTTETDELDFLKGQFPISWRDAQENEHLANFPPHHIKKKVAKGGEEEKTRVPSSYEGYCAGDVVGMVLGGSGDRFACALSKKGDLIGSQVFRVPPSILKEKRGDGLKDDDHVLLANMVCESPGLFYLVRPRDQQTIRLQEAFRTYRDAQKARIACEQRLYQSVIGRIFLSESGMFPEGLVGDEYISQKASDKILLNLEEEEASRKKELFKLVHESPVWQEILEPIKGCGERIAAGLISSAGDIRRFSSKSKLVKYCGVHVLPDGRFPRKRKGELANWTGEARQSLFLLGGLFNRLPDSEWGMKLRSYKQSIASRHLEPEVNGDGKKKWAKAHIHKTALWRTLTRFTEHYWKECTRLEKRLEQESSEAKRKPGYSKEE